MSRRGAGNDSFLLQSATKGEGGGGLRLQESVVGAADDDGGEKKRGDEGTPEDSEGQLQLQQWELTHQHQRQGRKKGKKQQKNMEEALRDVCCAK